VNEVNIHIHEDGALYIQADVDVHRYIQREIDEYTYSQGRISLLSTYRWG